MYTSNLWLELNEKNKRARGHKRRGKDGTIVRSVEMMCGNNRLKDWIEGEGT